MCVCSAVPDSLPPDGLAPMDRLLSPCDLPGKNTGVGCQFLAQRIFPTRDQTCTSCISCIGRWTLYHWATWEALNLREVAYGRCWGLVTYSLLVTRTICSRGTPYVGCMCPAMLAGLTAVSVLVGGAGPWHCWLPGFMWCRGCGPTGGQDWVLA